MITRDYADKLLTAAGQPALEELEKQIDADLKPRSQRAEGLDDLRAVTIDRKAIKTKNVIGVLEGCGPAGRGDRRRRRPLRPPGPRRPAPARWPSAPGHPQRGR